MIFRHALSAIVAVAILLVATPFIPSSVLIQLRDLSVQDNQATLVRTVTVGSSAFMTYEIGNDLALNECNRASPRLHFESRGLEPLTFDLICEPPEGEWVMRYCVSAVGWLGIRLAPTCIEDKFQVGPTREDRLEMQQRVLEEKIIKLEGRLNEK